MLGAGFLLNNSILVTPTDVGIMLLLEVVHLGAQKFCRARTNRHLAIPL
jgi:hypothetical protein